MRIPEEQVEEIIERNDIADVISEYVKLDRKSGGFVGCCPFHKEKTPSFHIHDGRQLFKCFGCGKGGNVVHFIMLAEGLDYPGALQFLADRAGVVIKQQHSDKYRQGIDNLKSEILNLNKNTARFFYNSLKKSTRACDYLKARGIPVETVKKFGLGYSPEGWAELTDSLVASGASKETLVKAGLSSKSDKNGKIRYYDRFRDRLMFPIYDVLGNVIGFGGRAIDNDPDKPKYINSAETPVYTKGRHLYGLNFARKSTSKQVIIVEGYMDCIALHQKGIDFAVASLGTALTPDQAKLLKKHFDEVIIAYDADAAGKSATIRGMDILASKGFRVKVFRLQGAKDADEYLRNHSAEDFIKQLSNALTLVEYKISIAAEEWPLNKNDTRAEFLKRATKVLAEIDSAVEREMYIKWVSDKYSIPKEPLAEQVKNVRAGRSFNSNDTSLKRINRSINQPEQSDSKNSHQSNMSDEDYDKLDKNEKCLLVLLAEDSKCLKKFGESVKKELLRISSNISLAERLLKQSSEGKKTGAEFLLTVSELKDAEILSGLIDKFIMPQDSVSACTEIIRRLKKSSVAARRDEICSKLNNPNISSEERAELMKELNSLLAGKK